MKASEFLLKASEFLCPDVSKSVLNSEKPPFTRVDSGFEKTQVGKRMCWRMLSSMGVILTKSCLNRLGDGVVKWGFCGTVVRASAFHL